MARARRDVDGQLDLFSGECVQPLVSAGSKSQSVTAAPPSDEVRTLAAGLPANLWLGTSSWTFPGWKNLVYGADCSESKLARQGLSAYARHPLLRAVGIDRTYYSPVPREQFEQYAADVAPEFRFLVKAPELLTVSRFPQHPRYGDLGGQQNPTFLNERYALEQIVEPAWKGLGDKLGCILFQFPPQSVSELGGAAQFAARLHQFFEGLPVGPNYAVEVRNPQLLGPPYFGVLSRLGVSHCMNVHPTMPALDNQDYRSDSEHPWKIVRWMLGSAGDYQAAVERYRPFDRLVDEDPSTRRSLAALCHKWLARGHKVLVIVNNKAEGSAPWSVRKLAEALL